MGDQVQAGINDYFYLSSRGVDGLSFNKLASPPLAYLDKGIMYELVDGKLYYNGVVIATVGDTVADRLATTGADVDVAASAPPTIGQVLEATSPTTAVWTDPSAGALRTTAADVVVDTALPPVAGEVLEAISNVEADWVPPSAGYLRTTGAKVQIDTSAPPVTNDILRAISPTEAEWTSDAVFSGGVSTDNAIARFNGVDGLVIQNSLASVDDLGQVTGVNLAVPATSLTDGQIKIDSNVFLHNGGPDNSNTWVGNSAGKLDATASSCTGVGQFTLINNDGNNNTAIGTNTLINCTSGDRNTCMGSTTALSITTADSNTIFGYNSGSSNVSSDLNTVMGSQTALLMTGGSNIVLGGQTANSLTTGTNNIIIGTGLGLTSTGSNNILIGSDGGTPTNSNTIHLGGTHSSCFIEGIDGSTAPAGVPVLIAGNGKLGTIVSAQKYKQNILSLQSQEAIIRSLDPIEYTLIDDAANNLQYGLLAEDVEALDTDLCVYRDHGSGLELESVDYQKINMCLLKEVIRLEGVIDQLVIDVAGLLP